MKKYFIFAAFAGIALASCTDDDLVGNASPPVDEDVLAPIAFSSSNANFTRADLKGAEAAEKLNNMFVVTGFKGSSANSKNTATPGSIVFDNYSVVYKENTANTTESNSSNWEYVGKDRIQHAIDNGITQQATKYWDYTEDQYDFIAWGMGKVDVAGTLTPITPVYGGTGALSAHQVRVSAIKPNGKNGWVSVSDMPRISYTFEGKAEDLVHCYISDLVTVYRKAKSDAGVTGDIYNVVYKGYQQPVTLKFRQLGTKVRIGLYETIPGYSVKNVEFYSAAASNDASSAAAKIFTTEANEIYKEGTYTIYFPTVDSPNDADNNQAHIKFTKAATDQDTKVEWGALNYTIRESGESSEDAIYLGRSSNTASYAGDPDDNYYVIYLPNQNGTNLNLRVNYTLESIDGSKETITVKGATAQVPSIYTTWKPGFAYTYLFKISDKTNGYTGAYDPNKPDDTTVNSDPAGLYPITFDAVVVNAEDGDNTQETITTISTPSITTYQNGSNVVNKNEYTVITSDTEKKITGEIYVTVNDGATENTPDLANATLQDLTGKAALYTIPVGKTEAEVVAALQMRDDDADAGTIKGRSGLVLTEATFELTNKVLYGADGNEIDLTDGTKKKAAKFNPTANTTYAFVYTKTAPITPASDVVYYEARDFSDFASGETKYRYACEKTTAYPTYDVNNTPTDPDDDTKYYDAQKGVKYYTTNDATAALITPFIGQGVSNLYLDDHGTTIATGYAVSGVDYYYTVDGGQNYIKAENITYNTTCSLTDLYKKNGSGGYDPVDTSSEKQPQDGTAYYKLVGTNYIYCVFLPQQVDKFFVLDDDDTPTYIKATEGSAIDGQTYFDKYIKNNGVYYAKVIKVQ
jgi:hypothetical protein